MSHQPRSTADWSRDGPWRCEWSPHPYQSIRGGSPKGSTFDRMELQYATSMARASQVALVLDPDLIRRATVRARAIGRSLDDVVGQLLEAFVRDGSRDPSAVADALLALSARSAAGRGQVGRASRDDLHER